MEDAAAKGKSPEPWDNFQDPPTHLHCAEYHPGRLLADRATTGTTYGGRRRGRPPPAYSLGFTPRDMRRLRFVTKPTYPSSSPGMEGTISHQGCVNAACWFPDGRFLFTGSDDRLVKVWAADKGYKEVLSISTGHGNNVFGVQCQPGAPHVIFTCAADGTIRSFDLESPLLDADLRPSGVHARVVGRHRSIVHGFEFWEGHTLFAALDEGVVVRYDLRAPSRESQIAVNRRVGPGGRGVSGAVKAVAIPDANNCSKGVSPYMLCVGGLGARFDVYDIRRMPVVVGEDHPLLRFCPKGLPENGSSGVFSAARSGGSEEEVSVSGVVFSQRRAELLVSYQEDQIYGFRTDGAWEGGQEEEEEGGMTQEEAWSLGGHLNSQTFLKGVRYFGPRDEYVVSGCDSGHTWVWDRRTGGLVLLVRTDATIANGVVPHPWAPALACYGIDNEAKVLEVGTGLYLECSVDSASQVAACEDDDALEPADPWPRKLSLFDEHKHYAFFLESQQLPSVRASPPRGVWDAGRFRRHVARLRRGMMEERLLLLYPWREREMDPETRRLLLLLPDYPEDLEDVGGQPRYLPGLFGKEEEEEEEEEEEAGAAVMACIGDVHVALVRIKERGNAFFKAKRYRRAASGYMRVRRWCEAVARWHAVSMGFRGQDGATFPFLQELAAREREEQEKRRRSMGQGGGGGGEGGAAGNRRLWWVEMEELLVAVMLNEGSCWLLLGKLQQAVEIAGWAVEARPDKAKPLFRRGTALMALARWEEAVRDLGKAAGLAKGDRAIQRKLAEARKAWRAQREREAQAYQAFFSGGDGGEEERKEG